MSRGEKIFVYGMFILGVVAFVIMIGGWMGWWQ